MKIKYFTPLCILLMVLCSISTSSQTKDKKWLLVDSLNYSLLSSEAKTVLDSILPNLAKHPHDSLVLKNLFYITENISENNVWAKYNDYMSRFLSNKPDTGFYLRYKGIVLVNKAYLAEHRDQNYIAALELYNESYEVLAKAGALADMATPLNNMATIYQRFGNNQKSLENNFKAMDIFEKTNNKKGLSFSLNNIANVYTKLNNIEKAREYLMKSYKMRLEIGDKNLISQSLNNIGGLFSSQLNADSALPYFNRSLQIAIEKNNKRQIGICYNNIGICYRDKKEYDKALEFSKKSLAIRLELKDVQGLCHSYQNTGLIYYLKDDLKNARTYFEEGFDLAKKNNVAELILNLSKCMYDLNNKEGKYKDAIENYKLYTTMKDSLNNKDIQKLSFQKQFEYEYNKKSFADSVKAKEEKMLEQTRHQQEIHEQQFYIIGGVFGFVLMAIIAAISLIAFKQKQKSNVLINKQKSEVEHQKSIIEEKQKEIIDSINYAKRIQSTLLANNEFISGNVSEHFTFFKPKDIVSGDFYWATSVNETSALFYLAICDSTGHGVPGAFMSLLNIGFLSEAINEKGILEPNKVFDYVRSRLISGISKEGQKDGFDGILLCIDQTNKKITYAAANNAPILIKGDQITTLKKDKMPVGKGELIQPFSLFTLEAEPGDTIYLYTDGFADQFGGPRGKKFMSKRLEELLVSFSSIPLSDQEQLLNKAFNQWIGNLEQVDDVLLMGIKI